MGFSCEAVENNLIVVDIGIGLFSYLGFGGVSQECINRVLALEQMGEL